MTDEKVWLTDKGQKIIFRLVQSSQVRRVYLKISLSKGLEIVVPKRFLMNRLPDILREKERWILKNLQRINERQRAKKEAVFEDGATLKVLGEERTVKFSESSGSRSYVKESEESFFIHKNSPSLSHRQILERFLRTKAKMYFLERTKQIASEMGLVYGKIGVRAQKSRWGSCSRAKNLNFNWRLIMTPAAVADYVIIHELSHTVHLNHSRAFYSLVEQFCPNYKDLRGFLRKVEFVV